MGLRIAYRDLPALESPHNIYEYLEGFVEVTAHLAHHSSERLRQLASRIQANEICKASLDLARSQVNSAGCLENHPDHFGNVMDLLLDMHSSSVRKKLEAKFKTLKQEGDYATPALLYAVFMTVVAGLKKHKSPLLPVGEEALKQAFYQKCAPPYQVAWAATYHQSPTASALAAAMQRGQKLAELTDTGAMATFMPMAVQPASTASDLPSNRPSLAADDHALASARHFLSTLDQPTQGHLYNLCDSQFQGNLVPMSALVMERDGSCFVCQAFGHYARDCTLRCRRPACSTRPAHAPAKCSAQPDARGAAKASPKPDNANARSDSRGRRRSDPRSPDSRVTPSAHRPADRTHVDRRTHADRQSRFQKN